MNIKQQIKSYNNKIHQLGKDSINKLDSLKKSRIYNYYIMNAMLQGYQFNDVIKENADSPKLSNITFIPKQQLIQIANHTINQFNRKDA